MVVRGCTSSSSPPSPTVCCMDWMVQWASSIFSCSHLRLCTTTALHAMPHLSDNSALHNAAFGFLLTHGRNGAVGSSSLEAASHQPMGEGQRRERGSLKTFAGPAPGVVKGMAPTLGAWGPQVNPSGTM